VNSIITYYGYTDGSGEYYIIVDSDRCSGCGECVKSCPQKALQLINEFIDLEDKTIAAIAEEQRKKIHYTCQGCKPETGKNPCVKACPSEAIKCVWNPR
jgi:Fe-S-cluster-containing hydrogenase component 2